MSYINTVLGPIAPEQLGITMMHEHLLWNQEVYQKEIDPEKPEEAFLARKICLEDLCKIRLCHMHNHRDNAKQLDTEEAVPEVMRLKKAGGGALVDCSCLGIGRYPEAEKIISQKTGLHIIMATGVYVQGSCAETKNLTCEEKTELFVRELTEGVDGTDIKAGVIGEIGVTEDFPECEQQSLAAAAKAQSAIGAAVLIHQPGLKKIGHDILDVFEENGGDLKKTVLCHCDPFSGDAGYLERLLQRGVNISFDQFGLEFLIKVEGEKGLWLPRDIDRIRRIARLCELGYGKQLVLSQDLCFKVCYVKNGGGGYAHILENILPLMRLEGIRDTAIRRMLVSNPARILALPE